MARKVILDVDPGIDDAMAVALALFDPELEVVAVTATGGNVAPQQATLNVQTIIEQLDPPRLPRLGAASLDNSPSDDRRTLHGPDGLGGASFPCAELHNLHPADKVLCDEVRGAPEAITLITCGPLTNIARAMQRDPAFVNSAGRMIVVGGSVTGPGNITAAAEFNIHADPASARAALRSRLTKTIIPLEVSSQLVLSFDWLDLLPPESTRVGKFLRRIFPYAFRAHRQALGLEGIFAEAAVGLAAVAHPELFETRDMEVDVETQGELTTGATVFDRRQGSARRANAEVAVAVDLAGVKDYLLRQLAVAAKAS